jgi:hypothetical protein
VLCWRVAKAVEVAILLRTVANLKTVCGPFREPVYLRGVPRGVFSKYITLDPLQHLGMTIRLEGRVAA